MKYSIIVPVYNEESNLYLFHDNIQKLDGFEEAELIYVDDFSTDDSWNILNSFDQKLNIHVYRLDKNYPVGYVRAFGVNKSKGEFVCSIDSDCIPNKDWLLMTKYLSDTVGVVGFPVFPPPQYDYLDQKFKYIGNGKPNSNTHLHGSGILIKKSTLLSVGNYPMNKRVGEDTVLLENILEKGYEVKLINESKIVHLHKQQNFRSFLKRYYRNGMASNSFTTTIVYSLLLPPLLILLLVIPHMFGYMGLLYLFVPVIFMSNPKTAYAYTKLFEKPNNFILKLLTFGLIKIAISFAFFTGVWSRNIRIILWKLGIINLK